MKIQVGRNCANIPIWRLCRVVPLIFPSESFIGLFIHIFTCTLQRVVPLTFPPEGSVWLFYQYLYQHNRNPVLLPSRVSQGTAIRVHSLTVKSEKAWLMPWETLVPHTPALFMTSHTVTASHNMAALTDHMFGHFQLLIVNKLEHRSTEKPLWAFSIPFLSPDGVWHDHKCEITRLFLPNEHMLADAVKYTTVCVKIDSCEASKEILKPKQTKFVVLRGKISLTHQLPPPPFTPVVCLVIV